MAKSVVRGKALVASLRAQPGVRDAEALAAYLGRRKKAKRFGKALASIGGPQRKTVLSIENRNRDAPIEYASVVNKDGKVIATASGSEDSVTSYETASAVRENPDAVFTHNHPGHGGKAGPTSFSKSDIGFFQQWRPAEMRASTQGDTYSLKPPASGNWPDVKTDDVQRFYDEQFRAAHAKYSDTDIPFQEKDTRVVDEAVRKTAQKYGYRYKVEKRKK